MTSVPSSCCTCVQHVSVRSMTQEETEELERSVQEERDNPDGHRYCKGKMFEEETELAHALLTKAQKLFGLKLEITTVGQSHYHTGGYLTEIVNTFCARQGFTVVIEGGSFSDCVWETEPGETLKLEIYPDVVEAESLAKRWDEDVDGMKAFIEVLKEDLDVSESQCGEPDEMPYQHPLNPLVEVPSGSPIYPGMPDMGKPEEKVADADQEEQSLLEWLASCS